MYKNSVLESESVSQRIVIYRTRRFIGEELILAIDDFSGNLPKKWKIQTETERQSQRQTEISERQKGRERETNEKIIFFKM